MSCCWFCHPGLSSLRSGTHLFDLNSNASQWCSICVACDSLQSTIHTLLSVGGTTSKHIVALIRSGLHTHFDVYHPRHECTPALQRPSKGRNEHSCRSAGLRPHQHGQISYQRVLFKSWAEVDYVNARWHEDGPIYSPFARPTPSQGHLCSGVGQP